MLKRLSMNPSQGLRLFKRGAELWSMGAWEQGVD